MRVCKLIIHMGTKMVKLNDQSRGGTQRGIKAGTFSTCPNIKTKQKPSQLD